MAGPAQSPHEALTTGLFAFAGVLGLVRAHLDPAVGVGVSRYDTSAVLAGFSGVSLGASQALYEMTMSEPDGAMTCSRGATKIVCNAIFSARFPKKYHSESMVGL